MKRPQPDINERAKNIFVSKTGANRKLKRLWGTTVINGVEVLNARRHYHKKSARPDNYERLFKFLKVYNDVKDYKGKGVKSAWFTLNKSNGPDGGPVSVDYIVDNLNRMWWDETDGVMPENLTLTSTITIAEDFGEGKSLTGVDYDSTKEDLIEFVKDNYENFWDNNKILQEGVGVINKGSSYDEDLQIEVQDEDDLSPDDPWMAILSRYALRSGGVPCTIKDVEVGLGQNSAAVYNTLVVTLEIPYKEFEASDSLVQRVLRDLDTEDFPKPSGGFLRSVINGFLVNNELITQSLARQVNYYDTPDDIDETTLSRNYIQWEDATEFSGEYENYWYRDGNVWYLRADVIDNPKHYGTTHVKLNSYIFSLLDTGYKKEKVPLWKKIVAVVIFVVAVILAYVYPPAAGYSSQLVAAAAAILTGALVISLVTLALGSLGYNEWAMAFASVSKDIEPLVTIASIIMIIDIIGRISTAVSEAAAKGAVSSFAEEVLDNMVKDFIKGFTDLLSGEITAQSISAINKAVSVYTDVQLNKIENIANRNKDLKAEYEKLAEETAMDSDVMMSYMNIYARPATADWSVYASTYDLPYERAGGPLSMGNIQRTTKQAVRKPDYKEAMFSDIIPLY